MAMCHRGGWLWGGTVPLGITTAVIDERAPFSERTSAARRAPSKQALGIMANGDAGTADIRAKMVQEYQVEF